jgi:mono/diheme cytochrome c family protein
LTSEVRPVRSVPHGDLAGKYTPKSLAFFLLTPDRTRPNGRMPSLNLKPDEAADITAYLVGSQPNVGQRAVKIDPSLVERGRRFFTELQCVQCHSVDALKGAPIAKPLVDLDPGAARTCVGKRSDEVPHYKLDPAQRKSIQAALAAISDESVVVESPLQTQMLKLNCYACHNRDGRGGVGPKRRRYFETVGLVDIGDEGRLPPPLDHVGRKLNKKGLEDALKGAISIRPHMFVRMPKFAASSVTPLANDFIKADAGNESAVKSDMVDDPKLASDGRVLFDTGCVQCHPVRGEHLPGVVGIDLAGVDQRIRPQWFHDFLLNPAALKTRTRMPTFFPDGRGADPNMLDGDAGRQIAALWAYIRNIEKHPLPQKILDGKAHDFELIPDKRPLLIRTFMKEAGTHAIAVGFGQKVHFALDAEVVRPAQAWRGRFLDAHGTWFDRFTPLAMPLGEDVVGFPPGVPFALQP